MVGPLRVKIRTATEKLEDMLVCSIFFPSKQGFCGFSWGCHFFSESRGFKENPISLGLTSGVLNGGT